MKLVEIQIENYTEDGLEISKWNEEKAKEMTRWVSYYFNASNVIFIAPSLESPGNTCIGMLNGINYTAKGPVQIVKRIIEGSQQN